MEYFEVDFHKLGHTETDCSDNFEARSDFDCIHSMYIEDTDIEKIFRTFFVAIPVTDIFFTVAFSFFIRTLLLAFSISIYTISFSS